MAPRFLTPEEHEARFWSRVDKSAGPDACWPWTAGKRPTGYGTAYIGGAGRNATKKMDGAHRIAYRYATGVEPGENVVCHSCDNPSCCNPAHLWLGTQKQNMADAKAKGRASRPPVTDWKGRRERGVHHWQRLTQEQAEEIRRRALAGENQRLLGEEFGINSRTVSKIKLGQRWS